MNYTIIQEVIDGCLLGDGCLEKSKGGKNSCFKYDSSSKEHVEFIHSYFKEYCTDNYQTVHRKETYDIRTNKTYVAYWFRTKCLPMLTEQYNRFYTNRIKHVPNDIIISPLSVLMWYIGDGELESKAGHIKLHTNSFTLEDVNRLSLLLSKYSARSTFKEKQQYIISIPRRNVSNFLQYIGICPINDYAHKWKQIPYKNKNIELNGMQSYQYDELMIDYQTGNYSIYELYKKYDIPHTCIKNYFNQHNINWTPTVTTKPILQYTLTGEFVKEWNSGAEIKNTLCYNASAVSEVCRGIRKNYQKFVWKFKTI